MLLAVSTTPAERVRPDSICEASVSTFSTDLPRAGAGHLRLDRAAVCLGEVADLHQRIDEEAQAQFGRQPPGRGVRGDRSGPSCSRSDITLRTEAGDSVIGRMRDRLREPTGSPVVR